MTLFKKLHKLADSNIMRNIQMIVGFYGVLSGAIFFIYFYIKINKQLSYWFLLSILTGSLIIFLTKKRVLNDKTQAIRFSEI